MRYWIRNYLLRREAEALAKAQRLLMALMAKHFPDSVARGFQPGNTLNMVIDQIDNLTTALELPAAKRTDKCYLIDIQKTGNVVKWRFVRGDDVFVIETYATLDSNVAEWRKWAGL